MYKLKIPLHAVMRIKNTWDTVESDHYLANSRYLAVDSAEGANFVPVFNGILGISDQGQTLYLSTPSLVFPSFVYVRYHYRYSFKYFEPRISLTQEFPVVIQWTQYLLKSSGVILIPTSQCSRSLKLKVVIAREYCETNSLEIRRAYSDCCVTHLWCCVPEMLVYTLSHLKRQ